VFQNRRCCAGSAGVQCLSYSPEKVSRDIFNRVKSAILAGGVCGIEKDLGQAIEKVAAQTTTDPLFDTCVKALSAAGLGAEITCAEKIENRGQLAAYFDKAEAACAERFAASFGPEVNAALPRLFNAQAENYALLVRKACETAIDGLPDLAARVKKALADALCKELDMNMSADGVGPKIIELEQGAEVTDAAKESLLNLKLIAFLSSAGQAEEMKTFLLGLWDNLTESIKMAKAVVAALEKKEQALAGELGGLDKSSLWKKMRNGEKLRNEKERIQKETAELQKEKEKAVKQEQNLATVQRQVYSQMFPHYYIPAVLAEKETGVIEKAISDILTWLDGLDAVNTVWGIEAAAGKPACDEYEEALAWDDVAVMFNIGDDCRRDRFLSYYRRTKGKDFDIAACAFKKDDTFLGSIADYAQSCAERFGAMTVCDFLLTEGNAEPTVIFSALLDKAQPLSKRNAHMSLPAENLIAYHFLFAKPEWIDRFKPALSGGRGFGFVTWDEEERVQVLTLEYGFPIHHLQNYRLSGQEKL
jgi:hypothetical protein